MGKKPATLPPPGRREVGLMDGNLPAPFETEEPFTPPRGEPEESLKIRGGETKRSYQGCAVTHNLTTLQQARALLWRITAIFQADKLPCPKREKSYSDVKQDPRAVAESVGGPRRSPHWNRGMSMGNDDTPLPKEYLRSTVTRPMYIHRKQSVSVLPPWRTGHPL